MHLAKISLNRDDECSAANLQPIAVSRLIVVCSLQSSLVHPTALRNSCIDQFDFRARESSGSIVPILLLTTGTGCLEEGWL
ncbi:MAG: hypothetical protein KDA52_19870, partial [Planctomycetaceae bacterium]|nr:hypothetical protein [Planctomycetaceae bacterium]